MHSSYALISDDFRLEQDGKQVELAELWPGGHRPEDRLGVLLAQPMDPTGCANLIAAANTLFYDHLRDTRGTGNFFRYADTFLFGVGCEPGDWNQLDVWPLHKFVTIVQPTAEAVLEAVNDRRITLLAVPESGVHCRGPVVLSTWNTFVETVRGVLVYAPRTGRATGADVRLLGGRVVESYVEQAIFSTPGVQAGEQARLRRIRRNLDAEPNRCLEEYRTLRGAAQSRPFVGVTEVLPPGHQELTRRATPTVIMPVEVPLPPIEAESVPMIEPGTAAGGDGGPPPELPPTLQRTPFDAIQRRRGGTFAEWEGWAWISDFGDPLAEHHAVREGVGIWDESPLQKWLFNGPDALRAADYCFTNDMAALEIGQVRYGAFCDERGRMLGDGTVLHSGDGEGGVLVITALPSDADHFRRICSGFDVEIVDATARMPHLQVQGPRSRELLAHLTDADVESLRYFRFLPERTTVAGLDGCLVSRTGYSGELGYEVFCRPEQAESLWQALLDEGASMGIRPYGLAAVESLRIEAGLIFIGFDYFPGVTSPFHMNLERVIKLDGADFHGREALQAEAEQGITHRMTTLVVHGLESPPYNTPVLHRGREAGRLLSPSGGRSPTVDRIIGMACVEAELAEPGTRLEVLLADGRVAQAVADQYPIYDPEKKRPRA
jgi:aminomethyltransferase